MENQIKKSRVNGRSVAYPSITLEDAYQRTKSLQAAYGTGSYSREDAAKGIGYSSLSGASARAVAALVHYGFLDRTGNAYTLSALSKQALFNRSEEEKMSALKQAALNPKLFAQFAKEYSGQALPSMLENIFIRSGVGSGVSKEVAMTFRATLQFAGLLQNGIVVLDNAAPIANGLSANEQDNKEGAAPASSPRPNDFLFKDTGAGWSLSVTSISALDSKIKKALIDVAELLDRANSKE